MKRNIRGLSIGVFGHYGNKNLGDESIIEAVIQNIRKREPNSELYGFSMGPSDTSARYGISAFPIRKIGNFNNRQTKQISHKKDVVDRDKKLDSFESNSAYPSAIKSAINKLPLIYPVLKTGKDLLKKAIEGFEEALFLIRSYKILKRLDILLITGSNQFLDNFGGPWAFPYTLLKWSFLAKLTHTKVYYISVGAGPLNHLLSMMFIRWALRFSDYTSLRDKASKNLIEKTGFKGKLEVYPDLAHSLIIKQFKPRLSEFDKPKSLPRIGINPMPMYDSRYWCVHDQNKYFSYTNKIAQFVTKLMENNYPFFFFGTQNRDNDVIIDILSLLKTQKKSKEDLESLVLLSHSVEELIENILSADIVVATRFHGTVLSLLSERPLISICYYRKSRDLMNNMQQGGYAVDLENFTVDEIWEKLKQLESNLPIEIEKIREKNYEYRLNLDRQYDLLFGKIGFREQQN